MLSKATLLLSMLLFSFSALAQKAKPASKTTTLDLSEALRQKLVAVEVSGTGGHLGECLTVTARNLSGKSLRVRIPLGQYFEPADSAQQTLVVSEARSLALNGKSPVKTTLKTFCAQAGDLSPRAGAGFVAGAMAPERLCKLLKFIAETGKSAESSAQSAVWCVTNGHALGSIGDPELTKFTAELLGKTPPGYRIRYETRVIRPGERAQPGKALVVEGSYQYILEKNTKVTMLLLHDDGRLIKKLSKEEDMTAGEHRGSLHLEVYNLPTGKYIVRWQTREGLIIKDIPVEF
ncbi:MAG: hypothetical protein JNL02_07895 [Saprospiraceae bacterium]|nr:hypothetical protein [Saprospiraceae bacterium]